MGVIRPGEFRRYIYQALGDKAGVIWPRRTCGLITTGECGSRLNAVRNVDEKRESGNRRSHGPGLMRYKEFARREIPQDGTAQLVNAREIRVRLQ